MRYIFLHLLLATSFISKAQNDYDSLKKFSYLISAPNFNDSLNGYPEFQGTGFFIVKDTSTFFVTAKHVIVGCNYAGEKNESRPSFQFIFLNSDTGIAIKGVWQKPIQIQTDKLKEQYQCCQENICPDTIRIKTIDTNHLFSINNLIAKEKPSNDEEIIIFGYPIIKSVLKGGYFLKPASTIISTKNVIDSNFKIIDKGRLIRDTVNYSLFLDDFKLSEDIKGFSGSPAFFRNKKSNWSFLGMVVAINLALNVVYITKPTFIFQ